MDTQDGEEMDLSASVEDGRGSSEGARIWGKLERRVEDRCDSHAEVPAQPVLRRDPELGERGPMTLGAISPI